MDTQKRETWLRKTAAASILPFAALGLAGCGGDTAGTEEGADVEEVQEDGAAEEMAAEETASEMPTGEESMQEDAGALVYEGRYDPAFSDEYNSYVGEKVTVSAEVDKVISDRAFTIAGTEDTGVEPLLIVHEGEKPDISDGAAVEVTGTVKEGFDLVAVENESGWDLDDEALEELDGDNYIMASKVDTSLEADTNDGEDGEE